MPPTVSSPLPIRSQADLAERIGVARKTVQRALTGQPGVSQKMRHRVVAEARKLGYRPNAAARTMRSGSFGTIALMSTTSRSASHMPRQLLDGAQQVAEEHGLMLVVSAHTLEQFTEPDFRPRVLREHATDGLLINYQQDVPDQMLEVIRSFRLPTAWVNVRAVEHCIHPDDFGAGRQAAEMLLRAGHREIGYISHHGTRHYSIVDRCRGVEAALAEAGLALSLKEMRDGYPTPEGMGHVRRWITGPNRPTAVICYEQQEAVCVYAAAMVAGLSVPDDLSVVSFGADVLRDRVGLPIDTWVVPFEELGRQSMEKVIAMTRGEDVESEARAIPFAFESAGSIRAVPG